ncbi:hypothetical protein HanRHA438_Chr08g0360781 [Helianthus annuus]|nr:hypothetical protein HanRHA438_Chr08g0360781 [Helianthus annuus]
MFRGPSIGHGPANLPHLIHLRHVFRQLHRSKDHHHSVNKLRAGLGYLKRDLSFDYRSIRANVVRFNGHRVIGVLKCDERLRPGHSGSGRVNRPCDPPVWCRGRRDKCY